MLPTFETERLMIRPLRLTDAPAIQQRFARWDVIKFMGGPPWPYPADGAERYLRDAALPEMAAGSAGHWALTLKEWGDDQHIGSITLRFKVADEEKGAHRGFWLGEEFQRRGLMTEAANAVTDYWFNVLDRPLMRIFNAKDNMASSRIKQHAGFKLVREGVRTYAAGALPTEIWEVTQDEWQKRRPHKPVMIS